MSTPICEINFLIVLTKILRIINYLVDQLNIKFDSIGNIFLFKNQVSFCQQTTFIKIEESEKSDLKSGYIQEI